MTTEQALRELDRRRAFALGQGGQDRIERHHASGRLTARERLDLLLDDGSLREIGLLAYSDNPEVAEKAPADAVITGVGTIDERRVAVLAIDATVAGGSTGRIGVRKQAHIHYLAESKGIPLIVLGDASGGRLPDLLEASFAELGGTFEGDDTFGFRHRRARIPRVTAVLGTSYGDPSFYAANSDLVIMTPGSAMGVAGPAVVLGATGLTISNDDLAGYEVAGKASGLAHRLAKSEPEALAMIRDYLSYLPSNSSRSAPSQQDWDPPVTDPALLADIVPDDVGRAYDVRKVVSAVVDGGSFFEVRPDWGRTVVGGLARVEGRPIMIAGNQPLVNAGAIDPDGLRKLTDLIDIADDFGLPIVCLHDLPGVMIGREVERQGLGKAIVDIMRRLNECAVPRISIVLRKSYGFGWTLMGGYPSGADYVVAWPGASIGFMAPASAVPVLYKRELEKEPTAASARELARALAAELGSEFEPWWPAGRGSVHDVIRPEHTRKAILDGIFIGRSEIVTRQRRWSRYEF